MHVEDHAAGVGSDGCIGFGCDVVNHVVDGCVGVDGGFGRLVSDGAEG